MLRRLDAGETPTEDQDPVRPRRLGSIDRAHPSGSCHSHRSGSVCYHSREMQGPIHDVFDQFKQQLPDSDPAETRRVDRVARLGRRDGGRGPSPVHPVSAPQARAPAQPRPAAADPDPLHQHDLARAGAGLPRRRGDGAAHPADDPLERAWRWSCAPTPAAPGIGGHLSTYAIAASLYEVGFNHFFRGKDDGHGRPDLLPGPRGAGHLRPRLPRGPADRGAARPLPAGGRARRRACRATRTRG